LERGLAQQQLVQLTYLSPKHGKEQFQFLPVALFYEQGVVYLRGERPEFSQPSTLRIDRVLDVLPIEDAGVKAALQARQALKSEIRLQILAFTQEAFEGFGLDENHGVYQETLRWVSQPELPDGEASYYEVVLQVREFFFLKQRLLLCGLPFRIFASEGFREELRATLESMRNYYQAPTEEVQRHG
jgi:predicted DNA-binding transcriptional regulator YafY